MERWACADVPSLALQILLEAHPSWVGFPVAVVDKDAAQGVILEANRVARDLQIKPGLRYAAGLSLSRDLRAAVVDRESIDAACRKIVDVLREFSPEVEADREQPGLFWLRATGLDRLFGGFDAWAEGLYQSLRDSLGFFVSITVGWTRFGTFATSRAEPAGWRVFDDFGSERAYQNDVLLDILGLPPRVTEKLEKLAITRVDEFLALSSSGVRKRFGPEAANLWRFAHGGGELPLQAMPWDEPVQATIDLDDAMWDMTQLTFLLKAELHPLMLDLAGRHCDLRELDISLHLEDGDVHDVEILPANPTLDEVRVIELCRLRLERLSLPAPITRVVLCAHGVLIHRDQSHLFRDNARRDLQVANHALARLSAEFPNSVCKVVPRDRHLPESRFSLEPFDRLSRPAGGPPALQISSATSETSGARAAGPPSATSRTLIRRIFDRPQPLPRFDPDIGFGWLIRDLDEGFVMKTHGPHRISGGWWMDGKNAANHIVHRRLADTSTHHVSPRARYMARDGRDGEFQDAADASMSVVAEHRGEIPKSTRHFGDNRGSNTLSSTDVGIGRDYYFAETDRGDVFWIYWDYRRKQWFLQGVVE